VHVVDGVARVAVLIDADNIPARAASVVVAETARHGTLAVKRVYGDWAGPHLVGWRPELAKHAITPIQQFAWVKGKNATDTALIIDAMDLLYAGHVDVFCLVSSDSDFTRLALRLRESGRRVYGIGERKTSQAFTNACDRFTFLEVLLGQPLPIVEPGARVEVGPEAAAVGDAESVTVQEDLAAPPELPEAEDVVLPAIDAALRNDGWAPLSTVGWHIVATHPSFDARNYGYAKLGELVATLTGVEVRREQTPSGAAHVFVRRADS
jgi:NYN domain/OST-HTH/LOTUS domain